MGDPTLLIISALTIYNHFCIAYFAEKSYLCTRKCGKIWLLATTRKNAKIAIQSCSPWAPIGVRGIQAGRPHCRPTPQGLLCGFFIDLLNCCNYELSLHFRVCIGGSSRQSG